ncbi:ABC transporter ATP-binding protein [Amnibacterium setariae]|uniref:ABC transporter ATP-binding protein n=1 Tax=Amnibacterium setariae TaxID=2306585 RepID=UPI001F22FA05|nr:ABC transporter ATP-binding protein [Amnibacterium setariae]
MRLTDVRREYAVGDTTTVALDGVSLSIEPGEFVAIVGPSGSGKSTLMNLVGCLDRPTAGTVEVAGEDVGRLGDDALTRLRGDAIGFVFQQFQLLPQTSALDNVAAPLLYRGERVKTARAKAAEVLAALGLGDRLEHDRTMLSGGQQQRVAIARAVVTEPALVLADEPTGALDSRSGAAVLELLESMNAEGRTIVLITHDASIAERAHRRVAIRDGRLLEAKVAA